MSIYCAAQKKVVVNPENMGYASSRHLARPEKSKATLIRWLFAFTPRKMSIGKYLAAYRSQKSGAKQRGIAFELTFKEWCDFWGDDIDRRGTGCDDLQMQRFGDSGPYALWNVKKGTPKQNMRTMGAVRRMRNTTLAGEVREAELDHLMSQESGEDDYLDDDAHELSKLGLQSSYDMRHRFVVDEK